jgi:hypothetical protein
MSKVNGTSSNASDSEHSDFDSKSNDSVSSIEEDLKNSNDPTVSETYTESNGIKSSAFVETLCGIPIVNDSIETVKKYKVGRLTIDLADAGARKVSDLAKPVSYKFSDHIEKADKMAAASVERLSSQFPLVKEPTDIIFSTLKEPAIQTITTVRQYHEQLGCTIEDNITTPGSRFVMKVDSQLAPLVNVIEDLLQKMIPDENGENVNTNRDIQNDQQQIAQTLRVLQIALATRDRCVEKMKRQLTTTQTYTAEQLKQLQDSSQLLSRATESVNTLNQTLFGMVSNLRETVQTPDLAGTLQTRLQNIGAIIFKDEENLPKAVQARIIELAAALLTVTDNIGTYVKLNAKNFPLYLQERLGPLVTFFEKRYGDIVNEIQNGKGSPLEKAKNILQLTTEHTLPLLRNSLSDLQEAIHFCTNSLNTSFHNTTDAVRSQIHSASQILNVK